MIRQALADPTPPPRKQPPPRATAMDRLRGPITDMLTTEPGMTARRIWERLLDDHNADISYDRVHHYVTRLRPPRPKRTPATRNRSSGKNNMRQHPLRARPRTTPPAKTLKQAS